MPKISSTKNKGFLIKFLVKSIIISAVSVLTLSAILSVIIQKFDIDMEMSAVFTVIIAVLSAAAAAFVCTKEFRSHRLVIGIVSVLPIVFYSLINEIVSRNSLAVFGVKILLIIAAGALFGVLSGKKRKKYRIK